MGAAIWINPTSGLTRRISCAILRLRLVGVVFGDGNVQVRRFSEVLELLERHGWALQRTWPPYSVFVHKDHELPLLIPVHDKNVSDAYVQKIKRLVGEA